MDKIAALFMKYEIRLTDSQLEMLEKYADMIIAESQHQNITAVTNKSDIFLRHFLDSAYLLQYLPNEQFRYIDIGTGGGIPGIPLSILRGDAEGLLLDSELRKIEFCADVCHALNLHAEAKCARAEELAHDDNYRGEFDIAVSRAMTNGAILCEMAIPFLRVGGSLLAMKGKNFTDEAEGFSRAAEKLGARVREIIPYTLEGEEKHLIIVEKTDETPSQYPRRFAKIKRSPL